MRALADLATQVPPTPPRRPLTVPDAAPSPSPRRSLPLSPAASSPYSPLAGKPFRYSYGFTAFAGAPDDSSWGHDLWGLVKLDHTLAAALARPGAVRLR